MATKSKKGPRQKTVSKLANPDTPADQGPRLQKLVQEEKDRQAAEQATAVADTPAAAAREQQHERRSETVQSEALEPTKDVGALAIAPDDIPNGGCPQPAAQPEPRTTGPAPAAPRPFCIEGETETHWIAETYSLPLSSAERDALAQTITQQGKILETIVLYEGELLDGKVRYQVAREHGIPC
jgi:hypothetical protein